MRGVTQKKPLTIQRAFPTIRACAGQEPKCRQSGRWMGCEYSLFIQTYKI